MDVKIITSTHEFRSLRNDWERLEKKSPDVTYYSTFKYNYTWWNVYKDHRNLSLFIIIVFLDNRIVGIAPLMLEFVQKKILKYKVLKFLGRGDYLNVIINFSLHNPLTPIKEIIKRIEENNAFWDQLHLTHINHKSLLAGYILRSKYNQYFRCLIETPYLDISLYKNYNDYKKLFIAKKTRQYKNKLQKKSNYRLIINRENVIPNLSKIHIKQKEFMNNIEGGNERHSLFEDKDRYNFYFNLYEKSNEKITYYLISDSEEIIGYDTGFIYKDMFHSWNIAFNPKYSKYHVGKVLNDEIILSNFNDRIWRYFDFGSGRYPWKFELTKDFNLVYELKYINPDCKKLLKFNRILSIKDALKGSYR
jgi:CelD/BcsL family acetyltransferase involved in cellulose biosynthesis